jgi:arylsulfatase A-like enzyme
MNRTLPSFLYVLASLRDPFFCLTQILKAAKMLLSCGMSVATLSFGCGHRMRQALCASALLVVGQSLSAPGAACAENAPSKPNIIHIMLDDWGYYEWSGMGHPLLQTPNIDRMAAEGMRFTQMLAGGSVCASTRCTLMLGQHTGHVPRRNNRPQVPLHPDDVTIAEMLKKVGYTTGGFGKWGLGNRGTTGVPEKQGFDWEDHDSAAVRTGDWKAIRFIQSGQSGPWELYDLDNDIEEANNVACEHPQLVEKIDTHASAAHEPVRPGRVLDASLAVASETAARKPPNILWIVAEDICPDLGCYGNQLVVTPHIDRLARQGIRCTNAFTGKLAP